MKQLGCVAQQITARVVELQGERSDLEMAQILGCSRPYYSLLKSHKRQMSYPMAKRASVVWPEVLTLLMRDLMEVAS